MDLTRNKKPSSDEAGELEDGDFVQLNLVRERRTQEKQNKTKHSADSDKTITTQVNNGIVEGEGYVNVSNNDQKHLSTPSAPRRLGEEDLRKQLFKFVEMGDKQNVQNMINSQTTINGIIKMRDPDTNENVLSYALAHDQKEIAIFLINVGKSALILSHHNVQKSGMHGKQNALHIVTEKHDVEMAKFLLSNLETKEHRIELMSLETAVEIQGQRPRLFSCLHLAAYYGHTNLVRLYLDQGMDVNHLNGKKDTALLWAARWGHNDCVNLLLDRGANTEIENDKGSTALHWAVRYEFPKTVELLLKKGNANPNTARKIGLVAPVIVAAAYGNVEIMSLLLKHPSTNINIKIRGGEMAIHHAAREGCLDIVEMLIKCKASFDEQDELGDTPLLLAAKSGHVDIVQELVRCGANVTHRNHEGHDAWYFAIENEENSLLQTLVKATRDQEMAYRHPLCIAASNGRCDKIEFLLQLHINPLSSDPDGNTCLHHAAMTNQYAVIDKFHATISVNLQNSMGNTPLHIACIRGFAQTIQSLLKCKAKADVKNKKGETALHAAAYSKQITAETVKYLIDYITKTHAWETLNARDLEGNNSLHIAGKFAKPEVLWEFRTVRFKDRDKNGLTPLHRAVRAGQPEALDMMLDIFEKMNRDARINEQSYASEETVLHLAADEGHARCVHRLISLGADVAIQDVNGDTVFHRLTKACAEDSKNCTQYLEVFDTILDHIVKWWCIKNNLPFPEEENQDVYQAHRQAAILFAINNISNCEGLSVLDQAFKAGVPEIISKLLMLPGVTRFEDQNEGTYQFDITGLTPQTSKETQCCCGKWQVRPMIEEDYISNKDIETHMDRLSGLEWLITHTTKVRAADILDIPPVRMLEQYYTSMVAWSFALLMMFHILYMSVFTYIGVALLHTLRDSPSDLNSSDPETVLLYAFVPLEPAVIIIYVLYTVVNYYLSGDLHRKSRLSRKQGLAAVFSVIGSYMFLAVCVLFAGLVAAWIALFSIRYSYQDYILAAALCVGWLLTISFTRGIRVIHYFYRMLFSIIARDMIRFLVVYLFVLMAFGFALHVLFQVSDKISSTYDTPGDTLFLTFNLMIGMATMFDNTFETNLAAVGRSSTYLKIFYLIYIILATIILLNVLIAMMNDSYSMILQENQVTWRIESVSLGVEIETSFPCIRAFSNVKMIRGIQGSNLKTGRWYVSMKDEAFKEYVREMEQKHANNTDAVSKRLDGMDLKMDETAAKLQHITDILEQLRTK